MHIGLIRHFPVEQRFPSGWKTAADLDLWRRQYDASPMVVGQADLGSFQWSHCISSDTERAVATAKAVFPGPVEQTMLLRELEFAQFRTGNLRLPVWIWRWILRLSWATGHQSQRACRDEFRRRVVATADLVEAKTGDILVVSHAGMMAYLSAEFRRRGFLGPKLRMPKHATLYLYEKNSAPRLAASSSEGNKRHLTQAPPFRSPKSPA
jgi:broad specificity phosphatase PhoE